jgi:hypothetical protein
VGAGVDHRSDVRIGGERITDDQCLGRVDERGAEFGEPLVIVADIDHPGCGGAVLAAGAEGGTGDVGGDDWEVRGVFGVDDVAGSSAEFEGHLLEVRPSRGFEEGSADRS